MIIQTRLLREVIDVTLELSESHAQHVSRSSPILTISRMSFWLLTSWRKGEESEEEEVEYEIFVESFVNIETVWIELKGFIYIQLCQGIREVYPQT